MLAIAMVGVSPLSAQEGMADMTADELLLAADSAYDRREFPQAAGLYEKFVADFGRSPDPKIQDVIRRRRYRMAMCYIQDKKYSEAMGAITEALAAQPPLEDSQRQELQFWLGVGQMQEEKYGEAIATLEAFVGMFRPGAENDPRARREFPAVNNLGEARMLIGTALLLQEKPAEAAAYFAEVKGLLSPIDRGRATVLQLYSLLQAGDEDGALALVREEFPNIGDQLQIVSFQTLTLQLGSQLLEQGRFRDAIVCLQRVWPRDRLLRHQIDRLADLESQLVAAEANPMVDPYRRLSLSQQVAKVKREIENFEKIENFDSALRLRLATAYQAMDRFRESALIMESMLEEMPPDPMVETASVNLVQCWNAIERWPKVIESANSFEAVFPKSASLPVVLYLQGIAQQKALDYPAAIATFEKIGKQHSTSEFAPRAQFMKGFTYLLADENPPAIAAFDEFRAKHKGHELEDAATYWRAMAFSLDNQFELARQEMESYLQAFGDRGLFRSAAFFRKAYCAQQLEDYDTSIRELTEYLSKFPGGDESSEARVLLGDALMNEGRMEEGIEAFAGIPKEDTRFYEEGVFKVAKALKLMEEYERMREHMEAFIEATPQSPRIAEAIYNIGWVHRQNEEPERARQIYWEAISEYGDDPAIRSVDDLFPALARLYRGEEEQAQFLARLRDLREAADAGDKPTLALRALWAQGNALRRADPERARDIFVEAAPRADVQNTNPLILADLADALLDVGKEHEGETMWRDLVKWNPRAPQKDRAFAALGLLELKRGNERAALNYFDRFERETLGSTLYGQIMLSRAGLLEARGQFTDARASLEALLASPYSTGPEKAEALFQIGEIYMKEDKPQLAVPYYQRIYVMHGRWRDWVARAYFRSGEAFEKLNDTLSARRTYQELSEREELEEFEETTKAKERLQALGGAVPATAAPEPEPAG